MREIKLIIMDRSAGGTPNPIVIGQAPDSPETRALLERIVEELNETELLRPGCEAVLESR